MTSSADWGTDGRISLPEPLPSDGGMYVSFGGFAFTVDGMKHDLTEVDREEIYSAPWSPETD